MHPPDSDRRPGAGLSGRVGVDQIFPIETLGQEIENNYDYWNDGTTFNHTWGEE